MTIFGASASAGRRGDPSRLRLGLPNLVWALAATHLVSRAGAIVQTLLVLYLTQSHRLSPRTAGAVVAAVGVGLIGSQLIGGWLSDLIGRRHTMLVGFLGTAAAICALGSADSMPAIWASAVGVGLMSELFRPAASAAIADLPRRQRIRAFGLLFWMTNVGFSIATVAAGILAEHGYGLLFWINATTAVLASLIVLRQVPETRSPQTEETRRPLLPVLARDRLMIALILIYVGYFTLFLQTFTTLPLMITADGHSAATYSRVLALNGILIAAVQPLAVRQLAGRDSSTILATSMLLVGVGTGLGAIVHTVAGYAGSVLIWTLGEIGIAVMFGATFADIAPTDLRGRYMGVAAATWSIGSVFGPLAGTALLDLTGRGVLGITSVAAGTALFLCHQTLGPALRRRATADLELATGRNESKGEHP